MNALTNLATLLRIGNQQGAKPMTVDGSIDMVIAEMTQRAKAAQNHHMPADLLADAVSRFWLHSEITSFRDTFLLAWGLCVPHMKAGPCIMEDQSRFQIVLDSVDAWQQNPKAFRRCYQGLVKSYFTYDGVNPNGPAIAQHNWVFLRDYLAQNVKGIEAGSLNPDWVAVARENPELFTAQPYARYAAQQLRDEIEALNYLCQQLGIAQASWFLRELIMAQVLDATKKRDNEFLALLPRLLNLLIANEVLRDRGLTLLLDRYAVMQTVPLHQALRDNAVQWWGNPWLPSNKTRWGGVTNPAREMIADWLKLEFIETFFTKLAEDGMGDRRRMVFWKRYVKSIDDVRFALGSAALNSSEPDFVALRKKMKGLICELAGTEKNNNAFIMTIGNLVAVEFSGMGNAFYGYDAQKPLPFDPQLPLMLAVNAKNSLKNTRTTILKMAHQDRIHGWENWEPMFAETFREHFDIEPDLATRKTVLKPAAAAPQTTGLPAKITANQMADLARMKASPYSRALLADFANKLGFQISDKTGVGGNLWVHTSTSNAAVNQVLMNWGFQHRKGSGWWK